MLGVAATAAIKTHPLLLSHWPIRHERFIPPAHFCLTFALAQFSVVLGFASQYLIMTSKASIH
jgi:hypothetical protein